MKVPVVDVNSDNFVDVWPSMILAFKSATFVSLDTELSGLGDKKALNARSIDDRYKTLTHTAKTRSIVSLGVSVFKFLPLARKSFAGKGDNAADGQMVAGINCMVQTFNITVLCEEEYIVEPEALKFLVDHGFDFNKQYSKGIPYSGGEDKACEVMDGSASIRNLFSQLIIHKVPVVFHNAIVDLGFMYENLFCPLPLTMGMFVSDLSEMFQGGIYDTKYITEFIARFPASYLDYTFNKSLRENAALPVDSKVWLTFPSYPKNCKFVSYRDCAYSSIPRLNLHSEVLSAMRGLVCSVYAAHGWCPKGRSCMKSHDIDLILDTEEVVVEKKKGRKRKRKRHEKNAAEKVPCVDDTENGAQDDNDNNDNKHNTSNDNDITHDDEVGKEKDGKCNLNKIVDDVPDTNKKPEMDESCTDASYTCEDNVLSDRETSCPDDSVVYDTDDSRSKKMSSQETLSNGQQKRHNSKGHRAGFDSFMTGFAMATFIAKFGTKPKLGIVNESSLSEWKLDDLMNKVYLSGKNIPLNITKTNFSKTSKCHNDKMERLMTGKVK